MKTDTHTVRRIVALAVTLLVLSGLAIGAAAASEHTKNVTVETHEGEDIELPLAVNMTVEESYNDTVTNREHLPFARGFDSDLRLAYTWLENDSTTSLPYPDAANGVDLTVRSSSENATITNTSSGVEVNTTTSSASAVLEANVSDLSIDGAWTYGFEFDDHDSNVLDMDVYAVNESGGTIEIINGSNDGARGILTTDSDGNLTLYQGGSQVNTGERKPADNWTSIRWRFHTGPGDITLESANIWNRTVSQDESDLYDQGSRLGALTPEERVTDSRTLNGSEDVELHVDGLDYAEASLSVEQYDSEDDTWRNATSPLSGISREGTYSIGLPLDGENDTGEYRYVASANSTVDTDTDDVVVVDPADGLLPDNVIVLGLWLILTGIAGFVVWSVILFMIPGAELFGRDWGL